jgi:hypothetical protein
MDDSNYIAEYPKWTTGAFMIGMGVLGGSFVAVMTATTSGLRIVEAVICGIDLIVAVALPTIVRYRFRKKARAQFAANGGDPSKLHFF